MFIEQADNAVNIGLDSEEVEQAQKYKYTCV